MPRLTTFTPSATWQSAWDTFYYFLNTVLYQNELNWTVAYTFNLPAGITLIPSVVYYFNLGPDFENFERGTAVETASSYLIARLDAGIPIYKDIISLAPWFGFGTSFDFNARTVDNERGFEFFTGAQHAEVGIGLLSRLARQLLSTAGAYSYQWQGLIGTEPDAPSGVAPR